MTDTQTYQFCWIQFNDIEFLEKKKIIYYWKQKNLLDEDWGVSVLWICVFNDWIIKVAIFNVWGYI